MPDDTSILLPRVILHNSISLDSRIDWFPIDIGLHYEIAGNWKSDIHLVGSETLLTSIEHASQEDDGTPQPEGKRDDPRPLLVVPDSRGRIRNWKPLYEAPYWRGVLVLCSNQTPESHFTFLEYRKIPYLIAGEDRVDFRTGLEKLSERFGARSVLVDSGGSLNGVLLRSGLVSEVSLLIYPRLVGGMSPRSFFRAEDLITSDGVISLQLIDLERLRDDIVWMRYEVVPPGNA